MSTRASIIIQDEHTKLYFYRHSDGYVECAGVDLLAFVADYTEEKMRLNVGQSAGWLVLRGHKEYNETPTLAPNKADRFAGWKCGAYEPTSSLHGDVEFVYVINLTKRTLEMRAPKRGVDFWNKATLAKTSILHTYKF